MQWTDLEWVSTHRKVTRPRLASDLSALRECAAGDPVAVFPAGGTPPVLSPGVWVTTAPMPETVKAVLPDGRVERTVPREEVLIADFPVVVPARIVADADSPDDLLSRALATGEARPFASRT